jgi:hypothetical protein
VFDIINIENKKERISIYMKREMVSVVLYEDGTYKIEDIPDYYATQKLYGMRDGKNCKIYHCIKSKWKIYLLRLLSTKDIDKQIAELNKRKKAIMELKRQIKKGLNDDDKNFTQEL